ncbi:hypothetical protein ACIBBB_25300 [Streptomyces sp. NPDC051217]|uniref:hypothetical protein n=1 Tax=Streptomyces sp. NPDC051217 TaxID=3365644 RepID=UPI0037B8DF57
MSPTLYEVTPAAPTWNVTLVHVRGVVEKIDSRWTRRWAWCGPPRRPSRRSSGQAGTRPSRSAASGRSSPVWGTFRVSVTGGRRHVRTQPGAAADVRERVQQSFSGRACGIHRQTAKLIEPVAMTGIRQAGGRTPGCPPTSRARAPKGTRAW